MARAAKAKKGTPLTPEEKLAQALVPTEEQPYEVPGNWCWTRMGFVAQWGSGGTPSRKNPSYYEGNIPWIKTGELNDNYIYETEEHITEDAIKNSSTKLFPINTVAIAMYGATIGKVGILGINATTNQACACAICRPIISHKYLFYYARSQQDAFIRKGKGGAQPNISQDIIKKHQIPLPPLAEQVRIVNCIESLFAKLDEVKERAQSVVDGFEDRKAAILHKAFNGELSMPWRKRRNIDLHAWDDCSIGELFYHAAGKALNKSNNSGVLRKYITTSNLYWGYFDLDNVREMYFSEEEIEKCTAMKNDLLVCNGGDVGRAAIWYYDYEICLQNHISKLRKRDERVYVPFFFYYFMLAKLKGDINGKGIGISSLSAKNLLGMRVLLPTLEEQQEISNLLDALMTKEMQIKEAAEKTITQIDTMKKAILARAFRGELGTNDPADESVEEILKAILDQKDN